MLESTSHGFIKFAKWNGDGFDISNVADGYFYGPIDVAFGPDDRPHIAWHDHQNPDMVNPEVGDAVHAVLTDGEWDVESVFSDGHDGWDTAIAVDSQGNVHMAGVDPFQFGRMEGIEYYYFDGEGWTVEQIGSGPINYAGGIALAVDSSGSMSWTIFSWAIWAPG